MMQFIIDTEEKQLLEVINTCEKSAFIFPEYMCMDFWRRLTRNKHVHTFIGKELYSHNISGFSVYGRISNFLLKRIQLIKTSGIFVWWSHFIDNQHFLGFTHMISTTEHIKPAMKGNVLLIFILLLFGLGSISAVLLLFELRVQLAQALVFIWYATKSCCIFLTVIREDSGMVIYKRYIIDKRKLKDTLAKITLE